MYLPPMIRSDAPPLTDAQLWEFLQPILITMGVILTIFVLLCLTLEWIAKRERQKSSCQRSKRE